MRRFFRRSIVLASETAAIPELLRALEIRGCLVSLDALGCQREIAEVIRERKADYLLTVKGNQASLKKALEQAFADHPEIRRKIAGFNDNELIRMPGINPIAYGK